jgi:hypothetical protein
MIFCGSWYFTCVPKPWLRLHKNPLTLKCYLICLMSNFQQAWLSDFLAQRLETDDNSWQQEEVTVTVLWKQEGLIAGWIIRQKDEGNAHSILGPFSVEMTNPSHCTCFLWSLSCLNSLNLTLFTYEMWKIVTLAWDWMANNKM